MPADRGERRGGRGERGGQRRLTDEGGDVPRRGALLDWAPEHARGGRARSGSVGERGEDAVMNFFCCCSLFVF